MVLCNADGLPEKGQKSTAATVSKDLYTEASLSKLPESIQSIKTCFIIDGMFIINTSPLPTNKTFQVTLSSKSSDRKCLVNIRDILKRYF